MTTSALTAENFDRQYLRFRDRQAGVSVVYSPEEERFFYNAYCIEAKLLKELFSSEHEFLDDALAAINSEFAGWELVDFDPPKDSGCGSCAAKSG